MFVLVWLQWFIWVKVELGAGFEDMLIKKSYDCLLNSFKAVHIQHLFLQPYLLQFALNEISINILKIYLIATNK
jgi:hypothetical protein